MSMHDVDGLNEGYASALLEQYLENPDAVPGEWRALFESGASDLVASHPGLARLVELLREDGNGNIAAPAPAAAPLPAPVATASESAPAPPAAPAAPAAAPAPDETLLAAIAAAMALVTAYRTHGHLAARLDPLGSEPVGDPALEPERREPKLTEELQRLIPAEILGVHVPGETLADALPQLREVYCGTSAYEIEHIADHEQRVWLRTVIESRRYHHTLSADDRRRLLERLTEVEGFERYLRRAFLGQKQFSVEGLDAMVPMLDEAIALTAEEGGHEVVLGMAHRGRLNVLAHVLGRPYETLLREFEGERTLEAVVADPEGGTGDVKYHLGAEGTRRTPAGEITVTLASNPSHLEAVDPVVEGRTRAEQTDRSTRTGFVDSSVAMAVQIHGDAAFPAQGVVAETLNLADLDGYSTGGTLHLIANNQIGFTTEPADARSTRYSSDLAKGFDLPIIHINADDPEAALSAVRLAMGFRLRFCTDIVIDLVGYRRHGHNEQDEAAYTQPLMAARIEQQPSVHEQYARTLIEEGVVTQEDVEAMTARVDTTLKEAHQRLKTTFGQGVPAVAYEGRIPASTGAEVVTAVGGERLRALNDELLRVPDGFTVNPKLAKQLERRRSALDEGGIDWGQAEELAFASLLVEGIPIRLTGQDTERGTFSHRHLVLHDAQNGQAYAPIQNLNEAAASLEIHNSPLSEEACLGFEYGYSVAASEALVAWEAQFGDFVNGAQVAIDQFIVSGLSKWGQTSRLTLLLPHGYEGNGPEHSSARLERFLQLAAQENIRIVNCTTAAQYFHLLRRQALDPSARPLVVMTPKGLLRLKPAASALSELAESSFRPVLGDATVDPGRVRRLVLCSGKVYYDLLGHESRGQADWIAVGRLEQLYPFPVAEAAELVQSFPQLQELVWAQEEPQNMGPWRAIRHRLEEALSEGVRLRYVGRPWRASPSEGYPTAHLREQDRIVREALNA
jgi:2-oxoglutarate dehydrogenase E1 component